MDGLGGAVGKIDDAVLGKRSAIVDRHFGGAAGFQVGDHDPRAEGKRLVRPSELVLIIDGAARGCFAVKAGTVPGSDTDLAKARLGRRCYADFGRRHGAAEHDYEKKQTGDSRVVEH